MRTITLRGVASGASALLGALTTLLALATPASRADDVATPAGDRIFETRLDAGYRIFDIDDDRSLLFPYDPLKDGPILGFDLLYLRPEIGTLKLEAGYLDPDSWQAGAQYNHGADFDVRADTRAQTHARDHIGPAPRVRVDSPSPAGMDVDGFDADPGRAYRDERRESTAAVKFRAPGYPAHVRASGRIGTLQGQQQMRYFFRSCSAHICHMGSRTREIDQVTREYTLGLDTHAGPVDLAYSHAVQTFRDNAADPVVAVGDLSGGRPAGNYTHDVNPDLRSFNDSLRLNTNLTNRAVLSLNYAGGEQENQTSDISRRTRTAGAILSWRPAASAFVVGRYAYDDERPGDLGAAARALREARNTAHAGRGVTHQHVVEPGRMRHTSELAARFSPIARADINARVRYRTLSRSVILEREGTAYFNEAGTTRSTLAGLDARYRIIPALTFDATLGREWTDGPVYAVETTGVARYGIGATWTPAPVLFLRASWQGFRGENDDADALQSAYARPPTAPWDPERTVSGDAFSAAASFVPAPEFTLTASWSLTKNGVEQDMVFGGPDPANPGYSYFSPDTSWRGRSQVANLRARWAATRRLTLTAEGMVIESLESYAPTFAAGEGFEELSRVEFIKLFGSLQADIRLTDAVGLTLSAIWTRYDDQADDAGDGTVAGALVAVDVRW